MRPRHLRHLSLLALTLLACVLPAAASAQGYLVKPMKVEFTARPGQTAVIPFEVRSTTSEGDGLILDTAIRRLTQAPTGSWRLGRPGRGPANDQSCAGWIELPEGEVLIEPLGTVTYRVRVTVPRSARGSYAAALTFQTRAPEQQATLAMRFRFVVPVIIDIQGRRARQNVEIRDATLDFQPASEDQDARTLLVVGVGNAGRTYSRITGETVVRAALGEREIVVGRVQTQELNILPGSELRLPYEIAPLPAGEYRLTTRLQVDGRRLAPRRQTVTFAGDPRAGDLQSADALAASDVRAVIAAQAGAMRTAAVELTNHASDPVVVTATAALPDALGGVARGERLGQDYAAGRWLRVAPPRTIIPGGGTRPVRVVAQLPRDADLLPEYYATLELQATYRDSQPAGDAEVLLVLETGQDAAPAAALENLRVRDAGDGTAVASVRVVNAADVRFRPQVRAVLLDNLGNEAGRTTLEGGEQDLLPLERRTFSGLIPLGSHAPGEYFLRVVCRHGETTSTVEERLRIEESDQGRAAYLF